jgi:hypothetical protein
MCMSEVNVSFCSPVDVNGELCEALRDLLSVYHESEPVHQVAFQRPGHEEEGTCTELHVEVEPAFSEQLREDVAATIREHHDCDVVVGAYEGEGGADFVHGSCQVA